MKIIMKIHDIYEIPAKGLVVGGTNSDFNNLPNEAVRHQIGEMVKLQNPDGSVVQASVAGVEFSNSLAGQKNVFLLLPNLEKSLVQQEAVVFGF